jgi:hypothetical protein
MNQDIKELAKLNCWATREQFLNYYTDLWTDGTYEHKNEEIWQTENQDEQGIMKEDLQTVLLKTKHRKSTGKDGINSELYKYAGDKFHSRLLKSSKIFTKRHKYQLNRTEVLLSQYIKRETKEKK